MQHKVKNNNNEWYTPKPVIEKVRKVFDVIDLDPCSTSAANKRIMAKNYYTKENSCLNKNWNGKVFLNPPYSQNLLNEILIKAVSEYIIGRTKELIILTNSGTDTKWNQTLKCGIQAYTIGRINFRYPDGSESGTPGRGQVFTYYGDNIDKFIEIFTEKDFCWIPNLNLR